MKKNSLTNFRIRINFRKFSAGNILTYNPSIKIHPHGNDELTVTDCH